MMKVLCTRAADCESGATTLEYALIAAILSTVLFAGADSVGTALRDQFGLVSQKLAATSAKHAGPGGGTRLISRLSPEERQALNGTAVSWKEP